MLLITSDTGKALGAKSSHLHHRTKPRSFPLCIRPLQGVSSSGQDLLQQQGPTLKPHAFQKALHTQLNLGLPNRGPEPIHRQPPTPKAHILVEKLLCHPPTPGERKEPRPLPQSAWGPLPAYAPVHSRLSVRLQHAHEHAHTLKPCTKRSICLREPAVRNESTISWNRVPAF